MSITTTAPHTDEFAERWREWQIRYAQSNRKAERQARVLFAVVLSLVMAWLALQI
jgi:hypothetical protein